MKLKFSTVFPVILNYDYLLTYLRIKLHAKSRPTGSELLQAPALFEFNKT